MLDSLDNQNCMALLDSDPLKWLEAVEKVIRFIIPNPPHSFVLLAKALISVVLLLVLLCGVLWLLNWLLELYKNGIKPKLYDPNTKVRAERRKRFANHIV